MPTTKEKHLKRGIFFAEMNAHMAGAHLTSDRNQLSRMSGVAHRATAIG